MNEYSLKLDYSAPRWAEIAQNAGTPDVEVCVRAGDEVRRYAVKNTNEIRTSRQDMTRKPRAFRIASLFQDLLNLAFCIHLIDETKDSRQTFDTHAFDIYDWGARLRSNPTILQLLLHKGAFIGLNRSMLSPDGKFMFKDPVAFVRQAVTSTDARDDARDDNGSGYEYSPANPAFAALLLEKMTGRDIDEVLDKYIFQRFGMKHTTLNKDYLESLRDGQKIELVQGHQIADALRGCEIVPENFQYMSNTMEKAFLGAWSTAEDLDILFVQLMKAYHNKEGQVISQRAAQKFFEVSEGHSLAGILTTLEDEESLGESPNRFMRHSGQEALYELRKPFGEGVHTNVYYKAGAMTGAAVTLCMQPNSEVCVLVLANLAAPVDVTPHIANLFLQDVFLLLPAIPIKDIVRDSYNWATALFNDRCEEDRNAGNWPSTHFQQFVGTYEGVLNNQTIIISEQQTMTLRRDDVVTDPLSVRSNGNIVRLVPRSFTFILDRQGPWSDVDFILEGSGNDVILRTDDRNERYRRVTPDPAA